MQNKMKKQEENKRKTGAYYEKMAGEYLQQKGYEILEYNYRCRAGEIDIVARDGEYLVFCEVKYRKDNKKGTPLEAVTQRKQRTISRCAMFYIMEKGLDGQACRFDVAGITGSREQIELIQNAFPFVE